MQMFEKPPRVPRRRQNSSWNLDIAEERRPHQSHAAAGDGTVEDAVLSAA